MSWTALVAEYLVIGFQGLSWVGLITLSFMGASPASALAQLERIPTSAGALLVFLLFIAAYSLGILLDHLFFLLTQPYLRWQNKRYWDTFHSESSSRLGSLFYSTEETLLGEQGLRDRMLRRRARIRILRAMFFNTPLLLIAILLHYRTLWIVGLGTAMEIGVIVACVAVHRQYLRMVARAAREVECPDKERGV